MYEFCTTAIDVKKSARKKRRSFVPESLTETRKVNSFILHYSTILYFLLAGYLQMLETTIVLFEYQISLSGFRTFNKEWLDISCFWSVNYNVNSKPEGSQLINCVSNCYAEKSRSLCSRLFLPGIGKENLRNQNKIRKLIYLQSPQRENSFSYLLICK